MRRERGSISAETTVFLAFFVLLFFSAVELGRALALKHSMDIGVYRAARYLSLDPSDKATAIGMIREEVQNNILGGSYADSLMVIVDMPSEEFGATFRVLAILPYEPLIPFLRIAPLNLSSEHSQMVERFP